MPGDAECLKLFLSRERAWLQVLSEVRQAAEQQLARRSSPIQWLPSPGFGTHTWLGFFWNPPFPYWFGYGLTGAHWLPLIEADSEKCPGRALAELASSLPALWGGIDRRDARFLRLWAPAESDGDPEQQLSWLLDRSRELNEFALVPESSDSSH